MNNCSICRLNDEIRLKILCLIDESQKQEARLAIINALNSVYLKYNLPESLKSLESLVLSALGPAQYSEMPDHGPFFCRGEL